VLSCKRKKDIDVKVIDLDEDTGASIPRYAAQERVVDGFMVIWQRRCEV
jgi:hypothetical protein